MSPRTLQRNDKSFVPVLYMAMELSNRNWKLLFGDGARRCQLSIAAGELLSLNEAVLKSRERLGLPARAQVVSCYEAGRDGFNNSTGKVYRLVTFRRDANPSIVIFITITLFVVIFLGDGFDKKISSQPLSNTHLIQI